MFDNLSRKLNQLQSGEYLQLAIPKIKSQLQNLIKKNIAAGVDPYGVKWPRNQDGGKPLIGSEKYLQVKTSGKSILFSLSEPASYHQTGTKTLPQRKIIPDGPLPAEWQEVVDREIETAIQTLLRS